MYLVYSALLGLVFVLGSPYWLYEMLGRGKYRRGLMQRLGAVPETFKNSGRRSIWVHAVSVGEVLAVSTLVRELRTRFPTHRVVVSTTTDTGQRLALSRFGERNVFYFPLDFTFAVRRWLSALKPDMIVIAETEFWPNFLRMGRRSGARIAIVNARISDRSLPGYLRWKRLLRPLLRGVDIFLAQTAEDGRRLSVIGADQNRISVTGNLKYDIPPVSEPAIVAQLRSALKDSQAGPVLVCGSTVEGEEPLLLGTFKNVLASYPRAVLLLAPRHPERFGEVESLLKDLNVRFWRRSLWSNEPLNGGVLLVDSIGELASLYALADVAFVGGSLAPRGGHNIIEPAQHGVAIVVGNHTENFREIVSLFHSRGAVRVAGPAELPLTMMELLANDTERRELGRRAAETFESQQGATQAALQKLAELVERQGREVRSV